MLPFSIAECPGDEVCPISNHSSYTQQQNEGLQNGIGVVPGVGIIFAILKMRLAITRSWLRLFSLDLTKMGIMSGANKRHSMHVSASLDIMIMWTKVLIFTETSIAGR